MRSYRHFCIRADTDRDVSRIHMRMISDRRRHDTGRDTDVSKRSGLPRILKNHRDVEPAGDTQACVTACRVSSSRTHAPTGQGDDQTLKACISYPLGTGNIESKRPCPDAVLCTFGRIHRKTVKIRRISVS